MRTALCAAQERVAACYVELPPGGPPEWVQLMPAGELVARDGRRWRLDDAAAVVAASLEHAGETDLVFDYNHQTDRGGEAPAAGWIKELAARADGIWGRVEWTRRAAKRIRSREFRYVSPTFAHSRAGRVRVILRAALTNNPALDLPALADTGEPMHDQLKRILAKLGFQPDAEPTSAEADAALARIDSMPSVDLPDLPELAQALGLAATAKAADILAAAKARWAELTTALGLAATATAAEVLAAAQAARAGGAPDPTAFVPRAEFDRVAARLNTLQAERTGERATAAVDDAIKAGKLAPAQRDWALGSAKANLEAFQRFVAGAPVIVTPAAPATAPAGDPAAALTAEELAVCKSLGLTEEAFKQSRAADLQAAEGAA